MANKNFNFPIQGFSEGFPVDKSDPMTSGHINNIRPISILSGRIVISQRPGLDKWGAGTQIGTAENPVVCMVSVSTVK